MRARRTMRLAQEAESRPLLAMMRAGCDVSRNARSCTPSELLARDLSFEAPAVTPFAPRVSDAYQAPPSRFSLFRRAK